MKSKAAIGNHPLHPMLVPLPIGARWWTAVAFSTAGLLLLSGGRLGGTLAHEERVGMVEAPLEPESRRTGLDAGDPSPIHAGRTR